MSKYKLGIGFIISILFLSTSFAVQANGLANCQDLDMYGDVTTIDFEGIATAPGMAGAVDLVGDEFPGVTLSKGAGAEGLFVGIPDLNVPGGNCSDFFAADFFPVSGEAVFSPDICINGSPTGAVVVNFHPPVNAVGLSFLDVEGAESSIQVFDGLDGSGTMLDSGVAQDVGDNTQAFRYVSSPSAIQSAVIQLGGGGDGVGMDDLCFAKNVLEKRLTSGPCAEGEEPYCENGMADDGFTFADGAECCGGTGPKEMVAGYREGGVIWDECGVTATATLTASDGFVVNWTSLVSNPDSCNTDYNRTWYATLICDDRSERIATTGFLNPSPGVFSGEVTDTDTLADHWDWMLAAEACDNPMVFVLAEQGGFPDGINQEWVAYADFVMDYDNVALVVETVKPVATKYDFVIIADPFDAESYDVYDTFPAEWRVTHVNGENGEFSYGDPATLPLPCGGSAGEDSWSLMRGGKLGKDCQSDTDLVWTPSLEGEVIKFDVATRQSPSKQVKFSPTSCGALYLNYGAESSTGHYSNQLCLAAVEDLNEDGVIDYTGGGDEDGDNLLDYEEACSFGTNPCSADSDGDGLDDDVELAYVCPEGSDITYLDPNNPDSDGDNLSDGDEVNIHGTNPCDTDTDDDGLDDDVEINAASCLDPTNPDSDDDGLTDGDGEGAAGTDPCDPDTDDDGVLDGADQCPLDGDDGIGVDTNGCPNVACTLTQYFGTSDDPIYWEMVIGPTTNEVGGVVWGRSILEASAWPVIGTYDETALDITGTNPFGDPVLCAVPGNQAEQIHDAGTCDGAGDCTGLYTRICAAQDPTLTRPLDASFGSACTLD